MALVELSEMMCLNRAAEGVLLKSKTSAQENSCNVLFTAAVYVAGLDFELAIRKRNGPS